MQPAGQVALLEDPHQRAVGGGDREEVHDHRLERQQRRAQQQEERDVGGQHDEADGGRRRVAHDGDEVEVEGDRAGQQHLGVRQRWVLAPDPAHQPARLVGGGRQRRVNDDDREVLADELAEGDVEAGRAEGRRHRGDLLVLLATDPGGEVHDAVHPRYPRQRAQPAAQVVEPAHALRLQRRALAIVHDQHDRAGVGARELAAQQVGAAARLGPGRQRGGVVGAEADLAQRQAQHDERDGDRHHDRPRARHHDVGDAVPEGGRGAVRAHERQAEGVHARTEDGEQGGQKREAVEDGRHHDDHPRQPHRADRAGAQQQEARQADGDGDAGEHDRAARRRERAGQRLGAVAATQLLAEAADDEQRVVDGDAQADHADDVVGVGRDRREPAEHDSAGQARRDGQHADQQRQRGGHRRAEDQQEQRQHQRQHDELRAAQVRPGDLGEVVVHGGGADRGHVERVGAHLGSHARVESRRQSAERHRGECRRAAAQLDRHVDAVAVARDARRVRRRGVPRRADARDARVAAQGRQGTLDGGPERRIGRAQAGMAEDEADRGRLPRQLAIE